MATTVETIGKVIVRKARKKHECQCGKMILPGQGYTRELQRVDGQLEVVIEGDHIHAHEEEEAAYDAYWEDRYDAMKNGDYDDVGGF